VSWALKITPENQNCGQELTKMARKRKNDEFLAMPLRYKPSVMGLVNHPRNPRLWAIAHENSQKRKNDEFLVVPFKHRLIVMGLVNHRENPKLWTIAHKNGYKCKNDEF
jgi:hypothetical protein